MQTINNEACDHICNSSFVNKNGQLFVPDQSRPEVFWAWASQHWIRNTRHNIDPQPLINQAFYDLGLIGDNKEDISVAFIFCLDLTISYSSKTLSVGCHGCGTYGLLEQITLACLAFQQADEAFMAQKVIHNIMSEVPAEAVIALLDKLSSAFLSKDMWLPIRCHYLDLAARIPDLNQEAISTTRIVN